MQLVNELPEIFEEFSDARKTGFLKAKEFKEGGNILIGSYCTFMPQELALAMGAGTVSLCSTSDELIGEAEKDLPKNLCPLIKSSYGFAKADKCPYFYFADLVVGETTCDGKKKMYELMGRFKPVHVMQLPNGNVTDETYKLWKAEIVRLKEKLEETFDKTITEEDIKNAVKLRNEERQALKNLYEVMKMDPPPVTGYDLFKVLYGATFKFNKEESIKELKAIREKILTEAELPENKLPKKPRILLTGCPVGGATEKVIKAIEDNGAYVVYFENCTGGKAVEENVDESNPDVYDALAHKYLNIGCSCMSPNEGRMDLLRRKMEEYKVDGVVDMVLQSCHPYAIETYTVKEVVRDAGKSYINIETDYSTTDIGQLTTRLSAFIEML